jgi:hypothetical protein
LLEPYATRVKETLSAHSEGIDLDLSEPHYCSDEISWHGWPALQRRAAELLGEDGAEHLLSMDAWMGCYVPVECTPGDFEFEDEQALCVGSLPALRQELKAFANAMHLPTDDTGLREVLATVEAEAEEEQLSIETFAVLLQAVHVAERRRQVLWVVK